MQATIQKKPAAHFGRRRLADALCQDLVTQQDKQRVSQVGGIAGFRQQTVQLVVDQIPAAGHASGDADVDALLAALPEVVARAREEAA